MQAADLRRLAWFLIYVGAVCCLAGVVAFAQAFNGPRWRGEPLETIAQALTWLGLFGIILLPGGILLLTQLDRLTAQKA